VSLTNKIWNIRSEIDESSDIVEILAKNRGIEDLQAFARVSLRNSMPDPFIFVDMERAANRIIEAIKNKQKIAVLGDYDVDGVSSVAILLKFFERVGADCAYSIPNRMDEGYGLSVANIEKYKDCLIIAVDCGANAIDELKFAKDNGIDAIVLDHHKMSEIPAAFALVNPHRPDETGDYKYLCAAGVVFLCVVAINSLLKEINFYAGKEEPDLASYLDLVALATVCDVVDLVGLNRAFVSTGLKIIKRRQNLGMDALLSTLKNCSDVNAETIAFFLGPKLNAAGRMESADLSLKLLTTKNPIEARKIALRLDDLNKERQALESEMMEKAASFAEEDQNFVCACDADWHIGIIGIIAGRLKDKYGKPSIVISRDANGIGKASCRSIEGVDISGIVKRGVEQGVILSGGGHALAAGFSVDMSKIGDLLEFLASDIKYESRLPELTADCALPLNRISVALIESIAVLEPFGAGNKRPKFVIPNVRITSAKVVGENHVSFSLTDENGNSIRGISFRSLNTPLGDVLLNEINFINALGTATISTWNGRKSVNFLLEDAAARGENIAAFSSS
jgi:single-stranded-DNA-specific exonuclease